MKKIYSYLICLILVLSVVGCTWKNSTESNNQETANPSNTSSGSEIQNGPSAENIQTPSEPINPPTSHVDIILDIDESDVISGRGLSLNGTLKSEVSSGDAVQIVGIGQTPVEAHIDAIVLDESDVGKGSKDQFVGLIFENLKLDDVKDMQRVVIAKHKKESELKPVETIDDIFGIMENGVYSNESFGFTINFGQSNFNGDISRQEGYRVSFESPASFYDFAIVYITSVDYNANIYLHVSNLDAVTYQTASEQLAHEYKELNVKPVQILLGDKEVSYVQFSTGDTVNECYAMNVNGYYIKWYVSKKNDIYNKQLDSIISSIKFDWVKE